MTWQLGAILFCLWLVAMYLILAFFDFAKRGDQDWRSFSEHQWKDYRRDELRRRITDNAAKQKWGGK